LRPGISRYSLRMRLRICSLDMMARVFSIAAS
jgi:hypothetical protein